MQIQLNTSNYGPPGIQTDVATPRAKASPIDIPIKGLEPAGNAAVDPTALREATNKINSTMEGLGNNLQFMVDTETSMNIVKVVDRATNETIRQFPSEETLAIAKALDKLQGLLIREKA